MANEGEYIIEMMQIQDLESVLSAWFLFFEFPKFSTSLQGTLEQVH